MADKTRKSKKSGSGPIDHGGSSDRQNLSEADGSLRRTSESPVQTDDSLTTALWNFFSDMKTAIVLLLVLALYSILGTVIPQNAPADEYVARYGALANKIIHSLGITNVYGSTIYRVLLSLVGINLVVCSINRWGLVWRKTFHPNMDVSMESVSKMQRNESIQCHFSGDEALNRAAALLKSRSFYVVEGRTEEGRSVFASKGRLALWGPHISHISLLVIFIGAIYGSLTGFNGYTTIDKNESTDHFYRDMAENPDPLDFRVVLRDFKIEHDAERNPTAYKSDLEVYEGDKMVERKVIDVNHPLTHKGIIFFQSDYGLTGMIVRVTGPNGQYKDVPFEIVTQNGPHGKEYTVGEESFKQVDIGGRKLTVFIHEIQADFSAKSEMGMSFMPINPAANVMVNDRLPEYKGLDAWKKIGWLTKGQSTDYKGFKVKLQDVVEYTGLQVSKNPGLPIIYTGFGLIMTGVFLSFYVRYRIVRVVARSSGDGCEVAVGSISTDDPSIFDSDYEAIRKSLNN